MSADEMSANKVTLKAVLPVADVAKPEAKRAHNKEVEVFSAREDAKSNNGGTDENKALSVFARKHVADENTPFQFEASTFEADGSFKPAIQLAIKKCFPEVYNRRYPSSP